MSLSESSLQHESDPEKIPSHHPLGEFWIGDTKYSGKSPAGTCLACSEKSGF